MDDVVGFHDTMAVEIVDKDAMIDALRQQLAVAQAALAAAQAAKPSATATLSNMFGT